MGYHIFLTMVLRARSSAKIQDFSQYVYQYFIDPVGNKSCKIRHSVPFSLAGEMVQFRAKNSAIWE